MKKNKKKFFSFGGFLEVKRLYDKNELNMDRIEAYFSDALSSEERLNLLRNLDNDDELKQQFIACQQLIGLAQLSGYAEDRTVGEAKLQDFLSQKRANRFRQIRFVWMKYAAVLLMAVSLTSLLTYYWTMDSAKDTYETNLLATPLGQRAQLILQDGTEVWLNANSKLRYPSKFGNGERRVEVEGEAFFRVAKDASRPFIVTTQDVQMQVLGTQFNVNAYPSEGYVETSLLEGSLRVSLIHQNETAVLLHPNEQVRVEDGQMVVSSIRRLSHFMWRDGIYAFENEPLINILKKMELYYDVKIVVEDASLFSDTYTGKFRQRDSLDDVFRVLQRICWFRVEKDYERNIVTLKK